MRLAIAILALLGLLLSAYLLVGHYQEGETFCNFGERLNCDYVNSSEYAELFGIPVALLGLLSYALILGVVLLQGRVSLPLERRLVYLLLFLFVLFGFLFSLYLTAVEAFILSVYCPLCVASAVVMTLLSILVGILWYRTPFDAKY